MLSRFVSAAFLVTFAVSAAAQMPDKPITRPKITGISHLAVYTSDAAATDHFYRELMGAAKLPDPSRFIIASGVAFGTDKLGQPVGLFPNDWTLRYFVEKNPEVKLHDLPLEQTER